MPAALTLVIANRCTNRDEKAIWDKMASIKSRVLGLWDNESEGIRLACIKFVQRVILVQTPGASDPRVRFSLYQEYMERICLEQRSISLTK